MKVGLMVDMKAATMAAQKVVPTANSTAVLWAGLSGVLRAACWVASSVVLKAGQSADWRAARWAATKAAPTGDHSAASRAEWMVDHWARQSV